MAICIASLREKSESGLSQSGIESIWPVDPVQCSKMQNLDLSESGTEETVEQSTRRIRTQLCSAAIQTLSITYQTLAKNLDLSPPNTINQLTVALECLIEGVAAAARPMIAAFVVSKARSGLPAPGIFDCARRFGRFYVDRSGQEAATFFVTELEAAVDF